MKRILIVSFLLVLTITCEEKEEDCQTDASKRIGAKCNDGTESTATGSGACSNHGGVDYWICDTTH